MPDESFNPPSPPGDQPANGAAVKIGDLSDITDSRVNVAGGNLTQVHIEHAHFEAPPASQLIPYELPYHNLPRPDYACFVGREAELAWLRSRLSPKDRSWQIAITGIGGVGKSALALAIAHGYLEKYKHLPKRERFDAIIWISAKEEVLTAQGKEKADQPENLLRTLEDVYTAIAHTLEREDITRALPKDQGRVVEKALKVQRTLLIMDNLESVQDERIKPFLRNLPPPTKAIITSREWLDVADVWQLKGLSAAEADQLILEEASLRQVSLDALQRQRIYDLTSGLPLPIKLAVARLSGGESFPAVERWLGDATGDLPEYCIKGQAELALQRDQNALNMLLACSLFDRSCGASSDTLGFVVDLSPIDRDRCLAILQKLFLINRTPDDRYYVLPILQRYISNQFPTITSTILVDRWVTWLLSFVKTKGEDFRYKAENLCEYSIEYPNIVGGIRWCLEQNQWEQLYDLAVPSWSYFYVTGNYSLMEEICKAAEKAAYILADERKIGKVKFWVAQLIYWSGNRDYEKIVAQAREIEEIGLNCRDMILFGEARELRSYILYRNGQYDESEKLAHSLIEIGIKNDLPFLSYYGAERISVIALLRGDISGADQWAEKTKFYAEELNSKRHIVGAGLVKARVLVEQKRYDEAEEVFLNNIRLATNIGEHRRLADHKRYLSLLYSQTNRIQLARQTAEEALEIYHRMGMEGFTQSIKEMLSHLSEN